MRSSPLKPSPTWNAEPHHPRHAHECSHPTDIGTATAAEWNTRALHAGVEGLTGGEVESDAWLFATSAAYKREERAISHDVRGVLIDGCRDRDEAYLTL